MMLTKIKKGIEKAKTVAEIDKIYFVWLQGESDAITKTTQEAYYDDLLALKNALKKDIGLDKFAIIKVGYFYSVAGWLADTPVEIRKKHDEIIMAAQEKAAKDDPDFVILTRITAELSVDKEQYISCECDGHYNNRAMNMIGEAAGKRLAEIANA